MTTNKIDLQDEGTLEDLQDLLAWWKGNRYDPLADLKTRPVFKGKRKNTGICINAVVLDRAIEKARGDKVRTGGTLSKLVETLLWRYIDRPGDVVEGSTDKDA